MDLNKTNGQRPPAVPPQHPGQGDENTVVYGGPQGSGGDDENTMVYGAPKPSGGDDENTVVMGGPQGSGGRATPPPQIPNPGQGPWTPAPAPKKNNTLIKVIIGVGAAIITMIIVAVVVFLCLVDWDDNKRSHGEESQDTAVAVEEMAETPAPAAEAASAKPYYPTHGTLTFTGKIDGKYKVSMTINTENRSGSYYYTKYGPKNKMSLYITSFSGSGDGPYYINMDEYNPDGEYCGEWRGTLKDGVYKGDGTYNGRYMPFKLQQKAK